MEYTESNCLLLLQAVATVDKDLGLIPWTNVVEVVSKDKGDRELAVFGLSLINKTLYGVPDQDTFYDHTDYMEELGMKDVCGKFLLEEEEEERDEGLMQQIQLYNVALKQEDGEPVTEDEISYLDEDATESGLRTSLRKKSGVVSSSFHDRKSLR